MVLVCALGIDIAVSQTYPGKPIRILTSEAGGANEFSARLIAQGISGPLGQPVVVEPRVSLIATETVAKAPPDGYTLLLQGTSFWVGPLLRTASYDPVKDFLPITMTSRAPNLLVVHPSLPVKSVKELIALARARPGELNYASGAVGGSPHLAMELLKAMAGVNIVYVAYRGTPQAFTDLIGGQIQLMMVPPALAAPQVKLGRIKALAVTTADPSTLAPGLPTVASSGLPGYEAISMQVMFAPANTPAAIINRLNQESVRVVNSAEAKERMLNFGLEAVASSPEQLAAAMKSEIAKLGKVIRDAGIKME